MKGSIVAVGVVVVAVGAYLGTAAVSGQKVETHLRALAAAVPADWPMVKVTDEHYTRTLLGATHTFTVRAACEAADSSASAPQGVTIVQHIKHGPFPGFAGFGAATVDTEVALDAATRQEVTKLFGTDKPFQAHTDVAFSGATHTHFAVARAHADGPKGEKVDFDGLTGDVDHNDKLLDYDVRMPAISVADAASAPMPVHLAVKGVHLHAHTEGTGELGLRPGKTQGELESMEFSMAAPDTANAHKVGFSQLKFTQDATVDNNLLSATGSFQGKGQIDDTALDHIELVATMKRLDAVAYQQIVHRYVGAGQAACGKAPHPAELMASQEVQAALMKMLAANPELSMDKLVVESGGKRAEMGYALGVAGFTTDDAKLPLPASLMTRGYGNLRVKLPEEWVQKSMNYVAQQAGQASGASNQAAMVELMLGKVIDQGYVVREDGMLRSEVAFKSGRATINGKPVGAPAASADAADPAAAAPATPM